VIKYPVKRIVSEGSPYFHLGVFPADCPIR